MAHDAKHKRLVNAIIDGEIGTAEIAKEAQSFGSTLTERLNRLTRAIVTMRVNQRITATQAKLAYVRAHVALSLGGFVRVAEAAGLHGAKSAQNIGAESKALGLETTKLNKIQKADFEERALELEKEHLQKEAAAQLKTPISHGGFRG